MKTDKKLLLALFAGLVVLAAIVFVVNQRQQSDFERQINPSYSKMVPHQARFAARCVRLTGHTSIWCLNWLENHH